MMSRVVPLLLFVCSLPISPVDAQESVENTPLHKQVDDLISQNQIGPIADQSDDFTFIRRVYLDLIGRIPNRTEVEAFLADSKPDRRTALVDRLLSSDEYSRHMAIVFDVMLMERRGGKHVKSEEFRSYLESAFRENRSYLEIVREILSADGTNEQNRSASAFFLERDVEPHLLTRDVGRVFYGVDLQCAQCHNHPLIDDYHQEDYYGLQAFFVRSNLFQPDKKKPALIAEQATGEASFKSVFTEREGVIGPRAPQADELVEVTLKPAEQYAVAPAKNVRSVPAISRREQLAKIVLESPAPAFNRNIVNRLWAHLFGRGIVHPVDLHHSDNPPLQPEVLDLLSREFVSANYDIKWLLRELVLTEAYQRSFRLPEMQPSIENAKQQINAAKATANKASEQAAQADSRVQTALEELDKAVAVAKPFSDAEAAALKQVVEAQKVRDAAESKVKTRQQDIENRQIKYAVLLKSQESTIAAVESLKDDKELAAALEIIQKRVTEHSVELQKQQEAIKGESQTLVDSENILKEKTAAADAAISSRIPYENQVRAKRDELFSMREQAKSLRHQANQALSDVQFLEIIIAYGESLQQIAMLKQVIVNGEQDLATNVATITKVQQNLAELETQKKQAMTAVGSQQKVFDEASKEMVAIQKLHSTLAESITKAKETSLAIPDDPKVKEAVELLSQSLGRISADVTKSQINVKEQKTKLDLLQATLVESTKQVEQAKQSLATLQEQGKQLTQKQVANQESLLKAHSAHDTIWGEIVDAATARAHVASLDSLSPEQFAMSMLIASGQYKRLQSSAIAKVDKEMPVKEDSSQTAKDQEARQTAINAALKTSLQGTIDKFVTLYGAAAGQPQWDFFATPDQSLFAANGNELRTWLIPGGGNLAEHLIATESIDELTREMYLSVLTRIPTNDEIADVRSYIETRPDAKAQAVQELCWGLMTSAEFRFQH
ncbi:DUF1549 domain-containing protein [Rubinisphaera sp.]|uniref:DUF1549 domain-containing protein n=1 Tax=Rubinisphaera sp. TaxID=2024857 RepID=UPI000C102924|nr:DUF1549 domain-containing protein [Rubinisphaera sp.]MBV08253.1 hypothetical protein [Rubinisphaera sp.]HCS50595.1 hypothetical protein [Planctomycetaceae bacterium]|tara:strand:- start:36450 stop:39311 length:2862 start_codon:yes stop_codon:yes gene_type:complete